jgi:hypothetical protein
MLEIRHKVSKTIWHAICKLKCRSILPLRMLLCLKPIFKGQLEEISVISVRALSNIIILIKFDVKAFAILPLTLSIHANYICNATIYFIFISTNSTKNVHSILIKAPNVTFIKVHYIESYYSATLCVRMTVSLLHGSFPATTNFEIKPERATFCVCVNFH